MEKKIKKLKQNSSSRRNRGLSFLKNDKKNGKGINCEGAKLAVRHFQSA
jgi:hypothetical protein